MSKKLTCRLGIHTHHSNMWVYREGVPCSEHGIECSEGEQFERYQEYVRTCLDCKATWIGTRQPVRLPVNANHS